jgi:hypothetical protein
LDVQSLQDNVDMLGTGVGVGAGPGVGGVRAPLHQFDDGVGVGMTFAVWSETPTVGAPVSTLVKSSHVGATSIPVGPLTGAVEGNPYADCSPCSVDELDWIAIRAVEHGTENVEILDWHVASAAVSPPRFPSVVESANRNKNTPWNAVGALVGLRLGAPVVGSAEGFDDVGAAEGAGVVGVVGVFVGADVGGVGLVDGALVVGRFDGLVVVGFFVGDIVGAGAHTHNTENGTAHVNAGPLWIADVPVEDVDPMFPVVAVEVHVVQVDPSPPPTVDPLHQKGSVIAVIAFDNVSASMPLMKSLHEDAIVVPVGPLTEIPVKLKPMLEGKSANVSPERATRTSNVEQLVSPSVPAFAMHVACAGAIPNEPVTLAYA